MSSRKRRQEDPTWHSRPRTQYENLSAEMATLKELFVGPRAEAYLKYRRMLDWLPEVVADRYAQAVQALHRNGEITHPVAGYLMMPFVNGVARARLATRPRFRELANQRDLELADQMIEWAAGTGDERKNGYSTTAYTIERLERRRELDYLREIGELKIEAMLDEDGMDWMDFTSTGAEAVFGTAFDAIRPGVVMPDGRTPTVRQFDRAVYIYYSVIDRGEPPINFRQALDAAAAEENRSPE